MNIRLFNGTIEEAKGIMEVDDTAFGDMQVDAEGLIALANKEGNAIYVALEDKVVGFVSLMEAQTLHGHGLWIDLIAVDPTHQNKGIGEQLVQAALSHGQNIKADYTSALVHINNAPSLKVLKKAGYVSEPVPFQLMMKAY